MKRAHRHTIMDGRVVTFAPDFRMEDGIFGPGTRAEPVGFYEISASRNRVIVHRCELADADDMYEFTEALVEAMAELRRLYSCDGRPKGDDSGEPREVVQWHTR